MCGHAPPNPSLMQVDPAGRVAFVWDDDLGPALGQLGSIAIRRASHVEPIVDGQWVADLSPVGGPVLGPFKRRQHALNAERIWLQQHPERWHCGDQPEGEPQG